MTLPELLPWLAMVACPKLGKKAKKRRKPIAQRSNFQRRDNEFKVYYQRHDPTETRAWLETQARRMLDNPTEAEEALYTALRSLGIAYQPQAILHNTVTGARAIVDALCHEQRRVLEANGWQHRGNWKFDRGRNKWVEDFTGCKVIEHWNSWYLEPGLELKLLIALGLPTD